MFQVALARPSHCQWSEESTGYPTCWHPNRRLCTVLVLWWSCVKALCGTHSGEFLFVPVVEPEIPGRFVPPTRLDILHLVVRKCRQRDRLGTVARKLAAATAGIGSGIRGRRSTWRELLGATAVRAHKCAEVEHDVEVRALRPRRLAVGEVIVLCTVPTAAVNRLWSSTAGCRRHFKHKRRPFVGNPCIPGCSGAWQVPYNTNTAPQDAAPRPTLRDDAKK